MVILSLIKVLRNQFVCARHCRISDSILRWMLMSSHYASNRMIHGVIFLVTVTKNEKYCCSNSKEQGKKKQSGESKRQALTETT
mmetsp:Transcript_25973/g.44332  ORF Transcript_25973/g.44332 Transcript_25973/m.44332 type:complete len:84 (+) Transcript_25973:1-252(+)